MAVASNPSEMEERAKRRTWSMSVLRNIAESNRQAEERAERGRGTSRGRSLGRGRGRGCGRGRAHGRADTERTATTPEPEPVIDEETMQMHEEMEARIKAQEEQAMQDMACINELEHVIWQQTVAHDKMLAEIWSQAE